VREIEPFDVLHASATIADEVMMTIKARKLLYTVAREVGGVNRTPH